MTSKYILPIFLGFYVLSLVFGAFYLQGRLVVNTDAFFYVLPELHVMGESFRHGLLPLWNPNIVCGVPLLANGQSACFYPPTWLVTCYPKSMVFVALLHEVLALIGFYLWLRRQALTLLGSFLGAVKFSCSGEMASLFEFHSHQAVMAYVPFIFLSAQDAFEKRRMGDWLKLTFFLFLQQRAR